MFANFQNSLTFGFSTKLAIDETFVTFPTTPQTQTPPLSFYHVGKNTKTKMAQNVSHGKICRVLTLTSPMMTLHLNKYDSSLCRWAYLQHFWGLSLHRNRHTLCPKKRSHFYFLNNSVKNEPILIIFWHTESWRNLTLEGCKFAHLTHML